MKNKILTTILTIAMTSLLIVGCGTATQEAASAPAEQTTEATEATEESAAKAEQTEATEELAEDEFIAGDEDQSDMPSDFLQIREDKIDFKDYDEIISL